MTDSVEVGVTHQIKIDRQDAWIKTSVQTVATVQKFKTEKGV